MAKIVGIEIDVVQKTSEGDMAYTALTSVLRNTAQARSTMSTNCMYVMNLLIREDFKCAGNVLRVARNN